VVILLVLVVTVTSAAVEMVRAVWGVPERWLTIREKSRDRILSAAVKHRISAGQAAVLLRRTCRSRKLAAKPRSRTPAPYLKVTKLGIELQRLPSIQN
jgi:hypothetical protein